MLLFFIAINRFVPAPWFVIPLERDSSMRHLCHGWSCDTKGNITQGEEFDRVLEKYRKSGESIVQALNALQEYPPAACAKSLFLLFGVMGYKSDPEDALTLSMTHLDHWACKETYALNPLNQGDNFAFCLDKAANAGSVLAMLGIIQNYKRTGVGDGERILSMLRHLAIASSYSFYKTRRGGQRFADHLKDALLGNKTAWYEIVKAARLRHYPSILWMADAVSRGIIDDISDNEMFDLLTDVIDVAPWRPGLFDTMAMHEPLNRSAVAAYYARAGFQEAEALLSYSHILG